MYIKEIQGSFLKPLENGLEFPNSECLTWFRFHILRLKKNRKIESFNSDHVYRLIDYLAAVLNGCEN